MPDNLSDSERAELEYLNKSWTEKKRNRHKELLERLDEAVARDTSFSSEDTAILHKIIGVWKWMATFKLLFPWLLALASTISAFVLGLSNIKAALKAFLS